MSSREADDGELTEEQRRMLARVLDDILPPSADGRLPGAGQVGLAAYIEETLRRLPDLRPLIVQGLTELAEQVRRRHGCDFAELPGEERLQMLKEQGFAFPLTLHAYAGYYQSPVVVEALGLPARPPHPQGYVMEPHDLTLLEPVRRRPPLYRGC